MDETKNEEVEVEESLDLPVIAEDQEDTTDWKAEAQKLRDKAIAQRERTKTIKTRAKEAETKLAELAKSFVKPPEPPKTGELDEMQLDYLDLKGITEAEDVKVIEDIVKKTGQTVRQALKDDYVVSKLASNKASREVKDATPSSTKRSGATSGNDLATAIAKYEQSGFSPDALPSDFALRSQVVNAITDRTSPNKPGWHQ
jgi:hypothetical protein